MSEPLAIELQMQEAHPSLFALSWFCGITYTILFVAGMLIQNLVNYKNKSTKGYSTDYALIAFAGFVCLLVNQTLGIVDPFSDAGRVHIMDEVFAVCMLMSSAWALVQCWIYPSDQPYRHTEIGCAAVLAIFIYGGLGEGFLGIYMKSYLGISWLTYAALGKALSTLIKYAMQALHNYKKKSVIGVSPTTMAVDLTASVLALIQMQIDSSIAGAGFFLTDPRLNLAKLLLSGFSGTFDAIILIQYFYIYPENSRKKSPPDDATAVSAATPLLGKED